jgi:hypothetical protein
MKRSVIVEAIELASAACEACGDSEKRSPLQWVYVAALSGLTLRLAEWDQAKLWSPE